MTDVELLTDRGWVACTMSAGRVSLRVSVCENGEVEEREVELDLPSHAMVRIPRASAAIGD